MPRIAKIAEQEGLHFAPNALEELVTATHSDVRQILNTMFSFRLTHTEMSYDQSKATSHKKDLELGPFDAVHKLLGSFGRMSMLERIECYFVDSSLVPLMVHVNMCCLAFSLGKLCQMQAVRQALHSHSYRGIANVH